MNARAADVFHGDLGRSARAVSYRSGPWMRSNLRTRRFWIRGAGSRDLPFHKIGYDLQFVRETDYRLAVGRALPAIPVLRRVAGRLGRAQGLSVVDPDVGRTVVVWKGCPRTRHQSRGHGQCRGHGGYKLRRRSSSARKIGTRGTSLGDRGRPTYLHAGAEHYIFGGTLGRLACAGAPIRERQHRQSGRRKSTSNLLGQQQFGSFLLSLLAKSGKAARSRDRIYGGALTHPRARQPLLRDILRQGITDSHSGLLAIWGRVVLMNPNHARLWDAGDQIALLAATHSGHCSLRRRSGIGTRRLPRWGVPPRRSTCRRTCFDSERRGSPPVSFQVRLGRRGGGHYPSAWVTKRAPVFHGPWRGRSSHGTAVVSRSSGALPWTRTGRGAWTARVVPGEERIAQGSPQHVGTQRRMFPRLRIENFKRRWTISSGQLVAGN